MRHGFAHLVSELSHGVIPGSPGFGVHAGTVGFERIVVVIVRNYPCEQVKPSGCQDFEQMAGQGLYPSLGAATVVAALGIARGSIDIHP
jgi:hypothetical protein